MFEDNLLSVTITDTIGHTLMIKEFSVRVKYAFLFLLHENQVFVLFMEMVTISNANIPFKYLINWGVFKYI